MWAPLFPGEAFDYASLPIWKASKYIVALYDTANPIEEVKRATVVSKYILWNFLGSTN